MEEADLDAMRGEGLSDRDILDVNLITSYFAYVNRIADGLGIALEGGDEDLGW
jgi:alkylhydroperoxidase family enzyme